MTKRVTSKMILDHVQAMNSNLQTQITGLNDKIVGIDKRITRVEEKVDKGFNDAREHRKALQEDLEATIRMVGKHDKKLARL